MAIASQKLTEALAEYEWLDEHLDHLTFLTKPGHETEVTGVIKVAPDKAPGTMKEGLTFLMTKFLRLVGELQSRPVALERLPEVVIGQVGGGYQAQVTLTIKTDTWQSPYTEASALGYGKIPDWKWESGTMKKKAS